MDRTTVSIFIKGASALNLDLCASVYIWLQAEELHHHAWRGLTAPECELRAMYGAVATFVMRTPNTPVDFFIYTNTKWLEGMSKMRPVGQAKVGIQEEIFNLLRDSDSTLTVLWISKQEAERDKRMNSVLKQTKRMTEGREECAYA